MLLCMGIGLCSVEIVHCLLRRSGECVCACVCCVHSCSSLLSTCHDGFGHCRQWARLTREHAVCLQEKHKLSPLCLFHSSHSLLHIPLSNMRRAHCGMMQIKIKKPARSKSRLLPSRYGINFPPWFSLINWRFISSLIVYHSVLF